MRKVAGSTIYVWESTNGEYFNVKIESIGILLTVHPKRQPKSYSKLKAWFEDDEAGFNPIVFSGE
jgi:hypothetical protein